MRVGLLAYLRPGTVQRSFRRFGVSAVAEQVAEARGEQQCKADCAALERDAPAARPIAFHAMREQQRERERARERELERRRRGSDPDDPATDDPDDMSDSLL